MKNAGPEVCVPWNKAQTEAKLANLEDTLIDQRFVLERFPPQHIHQLEGAAPLSFPDSAFLIIFGSFFRSQYSPRSVPDKIYYPKKGVLLPVEQALRGRELDFMIPVSLVADLGQETEIGHFYVNTTRVEGSRSIYHVFTECDRNYDYLVYQEGQDIIDTILAARVLNR